MSCPSANSSSRRAFTLIEMLVVVAIIALLVAILLPALAKAREQGRQAVCLANLHQIGAGMNMYRADHKGWLPVGPADKISYELFNDQTKRYEYVYPLPPGKAYTRIVPWSNCHWGGKRAAMIHYLPWGDPPVPEKLKRPLTNYLYRGASLDRSTPLFECPSDNGFRRLTQEQLDKLPPDNEVRTELAPFVGQPIHFICGNSYSINPWSEYDQMPKQRMRSPSGIVLAEEGDMEFDRRYAYLAGEGKGWHGKLSTYATLFLDMHVEPKTMPPNAYFGSGWYLPSYFQIMDYYR